MRNIEFHSTHSIRAPRSRKGDKAKRMMNSNRAIKFSKTLDKAVRLIICLTLLLQSVLYITVRPAAAGVKSAVVPAAVQNAATPLQGTPVRAAASAVVNFTQLAAQDAAKTAPSGPAVPQVIHSPVTPPEVDAPGNGEQAAPAPAAPQPLPAVVSPSPTTSFIGMTDVVKVGTSNIVIPPDTTGAVGLTQIFTTVNNNYVVQDKVTGVLSGAVSMDTFWTGIGATGPFDPRTIYDPYNDRWIVSAVSNAVSANSSILVGVSQTGNPGGAFFLFRFDYDSTNTNWADFPCMGFNKNWVAINCNSIAQPGPAIPNKALVLDYPTLRTGTATATLFSGAGFCAFPVSTYSSTENTLYVTTHLSSGGATYRLDTITGTPAAPAYALGGTKTRTGGGWTQPAGQLLPQSAPVAGASVCGATPCLLETQDAQVRSEPVFRNSNIYYAQTIGLPAGVLARTAAQWTKIDTAGNFVDGGRIDDPTATATNGGKWYAYASLSVNQRNDVLLGYTQFSSAQHPAAGYSFRLGAEPAGTMEDPFIYKAGEDYYHKDFGSARNRYGDYSKTQVDPSNDFDMWTMQEYAMLRTGTDDGTGGSNSSKWSTWWAKLSLQPTFANVKSFSATSTDDGRVLLQWNSSYEVDNLGFNVYREQDGRRVRITPQLVAGSALLAGPSAKLTSGNSYAWSDAPPPGKPAKYLLEDIDLNGKSAWNGPVAIGPPAGKGSAASDQQQAALLTRLGLRQAQLAYGLGSTPVERTAKLSHTGLQQTALPFSLAGGPAIKLSVNREGWYRVTQQELVAAGLDSNVNPRFLQLFVDGREIPITVRGEQDGRFDPADSVNFYGVGLDAASSDARVYWLVAGAQSGQRIEKVQAKGLPVASLSFAYTVERKDRTIYFSGLRNGDTENFFGAVIAREPVDQALTLQRVDKASASNAQIEIALQGVTQQLHQIKILLNGAEVGSAAFGGQSRGVANLTVPQSMLIDGENVVRLIAQAGETDVCLVDSVRITYQHTYTAESDALRLSAAAGQQVTIDGFTGADVLLFDVTNPDAVQELATVVKPQKGSWAVTAVASGAGQRTLLALTGVRAKQVASATANQPSNWRQPSNGADLLIITHRDFAASIGNLRSLRQSQGLSVAVVDVEDIYDEFSYGDKTPQAVKDFLAYANGNWKKAPRYVLLVGDSSLDPKNYLGYGYSDYVPTKLLDTQLMETASDAWLADFKGDGVEELALGRLPVRTAQEAAVMVSKIVSYDRARGSESMLLVADRTDGYNFESNNALLRSLIPAALKVVEIDRSSLDDATAKSQLIETVNLGQKIVNYTGHGSVNNWRGQLLTNDDALGLTNADGLSLFITMTCLNGYYQDPALDGLAESLMKASRGGAVAVWASSGMTMPGNQAVLNQELYRLLFDRSVNGSLGDLTMRAKSATLDPDIRRTWILFGDPSMKLK